MIEAFNAYLAYIAGVRNLSHHTVEAYTADLELFTVWLADNELTFDTVTPSVMRIFPADLRARGFAPASVNRILSCVRSFYRYAVKKGLCTANPASLVKNLKQAEKLPCFLFPEEAEAFCEQPNHAGILWQARDTALFSSLYSTGCRISELLGLTPADLTADLSTAIVYGKGKKERKVFFADFAQEALRNYLPERAERLRQHPASSLPERDALFLNQMGKPLTAVGVRYIINRYRQLVPGLQKLSPHAFRHSFASMFITRGADIRIVQELLGHSSITATQRYTHITAAQLHTIYKNAHPHG